MNWPWKRRTVAPEPMPAVPAVPEVPEQPEPIVTTYPPFAERPAFCPKCGSLREPMPRYCERYYRSAELHGFMTGFLWWTAEHVNPEHLNWLCLSCGALIGQTQPANVRPDGTAA